MLSSTLLPVSCKQCEHIVILGSFYFVHESAYYFMTNIEVTSLPVVLTVTSSLRVDVCVVETSLNSVL